MRNVTALTRRELISIFCSPLAYVVLTLFTVFSGFFFFFTTIAGLKASMSGTFGILSFVSLFAIPLITMRLLCDEYRTGTIESLMTAPVTDAEVVASKFLGALAFYLAMLAPTLIYVAILHRYGDLDLGPVLSGYAGLALAGSMFIALGLFCSSLSQNQIVAGSTAVIALLLIWVMGEVGQYVGGDFGPLLTYAGTESHLAAFAGGRIPLRDAFYFVSMAAFFLFLAVRVVESRRWRSGGMPGATATLWNRLTRWAILLGIVSLLMGLAAHMTFSWGAYPQVVVVGPVAFGALLVLGGILLNLRWIAGILRQRRFLVGLNVWTGVALSVIALVVANAIMVATPQTDACFLDMTRERIHTLSEKSVNILKGLDREVSITVLYGNGSVKTGYGDKGVDVTQRVKDLLRLYQSHGVKTQWVDIYADKLKAQQVALALKVPLEADTLVVSAGDQRAQIPFINLFEIEYAYGAMPTLAGFQGEEKITSAIVSLIERKPTTVCFLTGHGELAPEGEASKALAEFTGDLRRDNMKVTKLNLSQTGQVPEDCGLLVIAGPASPFPPVEVRHLEEYLQGGGKLLLAVKPRAAGGSIAGLEGLLAQYNVRLCDDEVVIEVGRDLRSGAQAGGVSFYTTFQAGHAITHDMGALNCYVQAASPVLTLVPEAAAQIPGGPPTLRSDWLVTPLLQTSPQGWGETNITDNPVTFDEKKDLRGPVTMAVAVSRKPHSAIPNAPATAPTSATGARLVILGATSILDDAALKANEANRTFALNCVNWLTERVTHLGIAPQRAQHRELAVSPALFRAIFLLTVLAMPLAAGFLGVWVWWARRR